MTKSLKIILSVLALASITISIFIIFEWGPFAKKTKVENKVSTNPTVEPAIPCIILEEQYCSQGKMIYENSQPVAIGFKLPLGSAIYSPFKGQVEKNTVFQLNGKGYPSIEVMDITKEDWGRSPERTYLSIVGYSQAETATETIEAKQPAAKLSEAMIDKSLGDYNLILNFKKYNLEKNEWSNDINLLRQYFKNIQE